VIISFFSSGTGGGAAPVDYLTARENRNLIRDSDGQPQTKIRDPQPEVLHGNPDQTRDLIDASANKWSYTAGVISFADSDQPSEDAQQEAIELFEALAFAGLETDQYLRGLRRINTTAFGCAMSTRATSSCTFAPRAWSWRLGGR